MSIITLTDRISVSVRAKNETQSNSQKRDTGRNIAKALGNDNISDALADDIGNSIGSTVTDEEDNEWVSMNDIINAGRIMKERGAFNGRTIYEGLTDDQGTKWVVTPVDYLTLNVEGSKNGGYFSTWTTNKPVYVVRYFGNNFASVYAFSTESFTVHEHYQNPDNSWFRDTDNSARAFTVSIGSTNYSYFAYDLASTALGTTDSYLDIAQNEDFGEASDANKKKMMAGTLFGPSHKSGGSLIDWDAPNAEVERQIKNLHDTWDVSDHAGAVTGNGTYVLAGPIEFNDGD